MSKMDHPGNGNDDFQENKSEADSLLQESEKILKFLIGKYGKESKEYKTAVKEYKELKNNYETAISSENFISKSELKNLNDDLQDIENILDFYDKGSYIADNIKNISLDGLDEYLIKPLTKRILKLNEDTGVNEIKQIIDLINKFSFLVPDEIIAKGNDIKKGLEENGKNDLLMLELTNMVGHIMPIEIIHNTVQEVYLDRIFGGKKRYDKNRLTGYNTKDGNYIIKVENFEKELKEKETKEINSFALSNYIEYLSENNEKIDLELLSDKMGTENLVKLSQIWFNTKTNSNYNLSALKALKKVEGTGSFLKIMESLTDIDSFIKNIGELSGNQEMLKLAGEIFKNNTENIKNKFHDNFMSKLDKSIPDVEKEKIWRSFYSEVLDENGNIGGLTKIYKTIDKYNSIYDMGIDIQEQTGEFLAVHSSQTKEEKLKKVEEKIEAEKDGDESRVKELEKEIKILDKRLVEIESKIITNRTLDEKTTRRLISGEANIEEVKKMLYNENEEYREKIDKLKEINDFIDNGYEEKDENKKEETDIKTENKTINNSTENKENNNIYEYGDDKYYYSPGFINTFSGESIKISQEEQNIVLGNPEAMKNIVEFYKTLELLGLDDLWSYKENIFKALSKYGIGFNVDGNYLQKNEVKIFLNTILKSVGYETINNSKSFDEFINIFQRKNELSVAGNGHKENFVIKGKSIISEKFIEKYTLNTNFNQGLLGDNIK